MVVKSNDPGLLPGHMGISNESGEPRVLRGHPTPGRREPCFEPPEDNPSDARRPGGGFVPKLRGL